MNRVSLQQINDTVSARLGPARVDSRRMPGVLSRQVAMYLARKHGWSLPAIGKYYRGRNHTTVRHAVEKISEQRVTDQELNGLLVDLEQKLASRESVSPVLRMKPSVRVVRLPTEQMKELIAGIVDGIVTAFREERKSA